MTERRYRALLVGNWHYPEDPTNLPDLKGPLNDVSGLAQVLADAQFGLFTPADVMTLTERASHEIAAEMEAFFADASRNDVLFVYYSGHGLTADDGSLLLCGRNARTDRKLATTVSSETVNRMIRGCAAAAVIIVLDCCHAGAFKSGDLASELAGRGRFVLTASRARDRAPDADHATGVSRFTGHLLRGLRGEAGLTGSDHVLLADLYRYVHRRMTADGPVIPQQRFDGDGEIAIARLLRAPTPAPEPPPSPSLSPPPSLPLSPEVEATLFVSEAFIDVGEVWAGDVLPVEQVTVTARRPDGNLAPWTATTEADWVRVTTEGARLQLRVTPREGATRANVIVCNTTTGETRTIRVAARLRPPAPTPSATPAPAPTSAPAPNSAPAPTPAPEAAGLRPDEIEHMRATFPRAFRQRPPDDLRQQVSAAFDANWPPNRLEPMVSMALAATRDLTLQGESSKADRTAREVGGIPPNERVLGVVELSTGPAWVVFGGHGVYWVQKHGTVRVAYREFTLRTFRATAGTPGARPTHVDLGDGQPRLAGTMAEPVVAVLLTLQEQFR